MHLRSRRLRTAPVRFSEETWIPGANNGYTAGRKVDMGHEIQSEEWRHSAKAGDASEAEDSSDWEEQEDASSSEAESEDEAESEEEEGAESEEAEDAETDYDTADETTRTRTYTGTMFVPTDALTLVMGHQTRTAKALARQACPGSQIRHLRLGQLEIKAPTREGVERCRQAVQQYLGRELDPVDSLCAVLAACSGGGRDLTAPRYQTGPPSADWGFRSYSTVPPPRKRRCLRPDWETTQASGN